MNNGYSKSLYDLYKDGKMCCSKFEEAVNFLVESKSGIDQFAEGLTYGLPNYKKTNIRTFEDKALKKAYDFIDDYHKRWRSEVMEILDKIPQVRFRMRFDNPTDKNRSNNYLERLDYEFTDDMNTFLKTYDDFCDEVNELFSIINDYEETAQTLSAPQKESTHLEGSVYQLRYNAMQGKLYLNEKEVYKCNLDSKLDKALSSAFDTPKMPTKTNGSIASALNPIKIPKELKKLMFRTSKNSFQICPAIYAEDLAKAGLSKKELDLEIEKLLKQ